MLALPRQLHLEQSCVASTARWSGPQSLSRRRYEVRFDEQRHGGAGYGHGGREEEARRCAVEEVPDGWIRQGEGEGQLKCGLPWEFALIA